MKEKSYLDVSIGGRVLRLCFNGLQKGVYAYFKDDLKWFLTEKKKYDSRLDVFLIGRERPVSYSCKERTQVKRCFRELDKKFPESDKFQKLYEDFFRNAGTENIRRLLRETDPGCQDRVLNATARSAFIYSRSKSRGVLNINNAAGAGRQIFEIKNGILMIQTISLLRVSGIVMHGCGIINKNGGYILLGVSGSGKSTLASLYGTAFVLSDDILPVVVQGPKNKVFSSPFNQFKAETIKNKGYPVKGILFLNKDKKTFIRQLAKSTALSRILKHHVNYMKLYNIKETKRVFKDLSELVDVTPVFELHFEKNKKFIKLLKQI